MAYFGPLPIAEGAELRLWEAGDAAELTEVVAANREHLATWMPWAETYGFQDSVEFLELKRLQVEANDGFEAARHRRRARSPAASASTASTGSTARPRSATGSPPMPRAAA